MRLNHPHLSLPRLVTFLLAALGVAAIGLAPLGLVACGPTSSSEPHGGGQRDAGLTDGGGWVPPQDASVSYEGGCPTCQQDAAACAAETTKAAQMPLDIYIMLDQSASMGDPAGSGSSTKWLLVAGALQAFLQQPLTDVSVGIQFFGIPVGLFGGSDSCNAADYANPAVEIQPLPGVFDAIKNAVAAHTPNTLTPTSAALQGAISHAWSWGGQNPDHVTIVIFATDGEPTECDEDLNHINAIAASGVSANPSILTFVIGVGALLTNLNGIAAAGGTTQAFLVDTGGNVQQDILDALNQIRGVALGCSYRIPDAGDAGIVDYTKVNVRYTPGSTGTPEVIPQASSEANCPASGDAWYYDNPTAPTKIQLCPSTCDRITPDTSGQVDILVGCQTQVIE
jgi:hypothetical protein